MKGTLAWPGEVTGVGLLEPRVAGLREAPAPTVGSDRRDQLQVVGVKRENTQEPGEAREVGVNGPLQVRHPASTPVLQILA